MELDGLKDLISELGFPIFVAVYLLIWNRKTLKSLEKAVTKLTEAIIKLAKGD